MIKSINIKKITLVLLFFATSAVYAQYSNTPAKMYLKSGQILIGQAKLKLFSMHERSSKEEVVRFKSGDKKQKIEASAIDSIVFTVTLKKKVNKKKLEFTEQQTFVPIYIDKKDEQPRMFQLVEDNKLRVYSRGIQTAAMNGASGTASFYSIKHILVKSSDDEALVRLLPYGPKKFRKEASKYFSNCPELVKKIESKAYKRDDIMDIIAYYNTNCN